MPASTALPLACVIGDMDLVRPLGRAGIPCAVVAPPGSPPTLSRHVRAVIPWRGGPDDALVEALLRFAATVPALPVLFVQDDAALLAVSRRREHLAPAFRLALAEPALVEALVDKARFADLARRLGLPVPPARRLAPGEVAGDPGLPLPVIVKPLTRDAAWDAAAGGAKALAAATEQEFRALMRRLAPLGAELLVQAQIPGPETRIESHHAYVDATGAVAAEFTGRKLRTWPRACGQSCAVEITEAPDVAALGREVLRRLGLRGVAKLDFKRGPDGALHLLEVNPRCTLWHNLGAAAGVNIPALVHADLCGLPRPRLSPARAGAAWCRPGEDLRAAREAGMGAGAWLGWMAGCAARAELDPRDLRPFLQGVVLNGALRALRGRR